MSTDLISLDLPLDDIIGAYEKYHLSKIAFHQEALAKVRSMKFSNNLDGVSDRPSEGFDKPTFYHNGAELEISQRNIKDLVYGFLKLNPNRLWATSDIYENGFMVMYDADATNRKEWIAAISSSLNNLQVNDKIRSFPNKAGRGNLYGINDPSISKHQDALSDFSDIEASEDEDDDFFKPKNPTNRAF